MEDELDLSALIIQLTSLRLRETRILEQLEWTRAQETRVIQQIKGAQECRCPRWPVIQEVVAGPQPPPPLPLVVAQEEIIRTDPFFIGERVQIHNKVRRCAGHLPVTEAD